MALFRIPLLLNRDIFFWKLLGCGKGGGFRKTPDWKQWAILTTRQTIPGALSTAALYGGFIAWWLRCWRCSIRTLLLEPVEGRGSWDGRAAFGAFDGSSFHPDEKVAVLTRATIRPGKLRRFWKHVPALNKQMKDTPGLTESLSIGELPFIRQATLSIWENMEQMRAFAYRMQEHREIIKKTKDENWYREDMFVRFRILDDSLWKL